MTKALETYGLKPMPFAKTFEIDGFNLLVRLDQDDDDSHDDDYLKMTFCTRLDHPVTEFVSVSLSGPAETVEEAFGKIDGRQALESLLNSVGPLLAKL